MQANIGWPSRRGGQLPCDTATLEDALWDLQVYTLRVANMHSAEWRGDRSSPRKTSCDALYCAATAWDAGLTIEKRKLLDWVSGRADRLDRHLRRHLMAPARGSLLWRIVYGTDYDLLRLDTTLSPSEVTALAIARVHSGDPVALRRRDRRAYSKFSRDFHLKSKVEDRVQPQHLQLVDGRKATRVAKVKANLASYFESLRPMMQLPSMGHFDIVAQIEEYYGEKTTPLNGGSVLEKHLRMARVDNGYGAPPVDVEDVLPDMTACLNAAVSQWCKQKTMERRYGIARRQPGLREGQSFSGVADVEYE